MGQTGMNSHYSGTKAQFVAITGCFNIFLYGHDQANVHTFLVQEYKCGMYTFFQKSRECIQFFKKYSAGCFFCRCDWGGKRFRRCDWGGKNFRRCDSYYIRRCDYYSTWNIFRRCDSKPGVGHSEGRAAIFRQEIYIQSNFRQILLPANFRQKLRGPAIFRHP